MIHFTAGDIPRDAPLDRRLTNWLFYTVGFAVFPLAASLILRFLTDKLTTDAVANSPEILFFSLIVSASAGGDVHDIAQHITNDNNILAFLQKALLAGSFFSAFLYGAFLFDTIIEPQSPIFRPNLLLPSIALAIVFFALSLIVEMLVSRVMATK